MIKSFHIIYEEAVRELEQTNTSGEQLINLVLTNEFENFNITNASVIGLSVVPAIPPAPFTPLSLPPLYKNTTLKDQGIIVVETIEIVPPPVEMMKSPLTLSFRLKCRSHIHMS